MNTVISNEDGFIINYNSEIYPKEVVVKAAYRFIDQAYIHLDKEEINYVIKVLIKDKKDSITREMLDEEMLTQLARYVVAEKTKEIRKMTMARAFASTIIDDTPKKEGENECSNIDLPEAENILKDWFDNE